MNKIDIYQYLKDLKVWYETLEHQAIYNMDEAATIKLPYPLNDAKNLFVRDDKKQNYYLITVKGNKIVNLKKLKEEYNTRSLSFVSSIEMKQKMNLEPGSVSPFGLLNDQKKEIIFMLDEEFLKEPAIIGIHPNDNTATIFLKTLDLIEIIKDHGNIVTLVNITEK